MHVRQFMATPIYFIVNKGLCSYVVIRGILKIFLESLYFW